MGELFAPFTIVAASNPFAAAPHRPHRRRAGHGDRTQPDDRRPLPALPGRPRPGQPGRGRGADVGRHRARGRDPRVAVGVPARLRRPARAQPARPCRPVDRPGVGPGRAHRARAGRAHDSTTSTTFDLYSCFPIAVLNICDGLGLSPTDPRGLTLTGGLPFFGGAGNNYSMHAVAETVARVREHPGQLRLRRRQRRGAEQVLGRRLLVAPRAWTEWSDADLQAELDAVTGPAVGHRAAGRGTSRPTPSPTAATGPGIIIGRLPDGSRFRPPPRPATTHPRRAAGRRRVRVADPPLHRRREAQLRVGGRGRPRRSLLGGRAADRDERRLVPARAAPAARSSRSVIRQPSGVRTHLST